MSLFSFSPLWKEPAIIPGFDASLPVSGGHSIRYQVRGNNAGKPVLVIHGGPGRGIDNSIWSIFNPKKYRIILVDQRGCGLSTPRGRLENNDPWRVIEDFESLRVFLGIDKWMVFGCGFGLFLGIVYAEKHPKRVPEIIGNNLMTPREKELAWLFSDGGGASQHLPMEWRRFRKPVEQVPAFLLPRWQRFMRLLRRGSPDQSSQNMDHHTLLKRYYRLVTSDKVDDKERTAAVEAWTRWENAISGDRNINGPPKTVGDDQALVVAKIALHYFLHNGFLEDDNQVLRDMHILRENKIKGVIVHGGNDQVNPISNALELFEAWPEAHYIVVPNAGHSTRDAEIQKVLVQAAEDFAGCGCLFQIRKKEEVQHAPPCFP